MAITSAESVNIAGRKAKAAGTWRPPTTEREAALRRFAKTEGISIEEARAALGGPSYVTRGGKVTSISYQIPIGETSQEQIAKKQTAVIEQIKQGEIEQLPVKQERISRTTDRFVAATTDTKTTKEEPEVSYGGLNISGGIDPARFFWGTREERIKQGGGYFATGGEIGADEGLYFIPASGRKLTFTESLGVLIGETKFGKTGIGQNLIKNLEKTSAAIKKDTEIIAFEEQASSADILKTTGYPGLIRSKFYKAGQEFGKIVGSETIGRISGQLALGVFFLGPTTATTSQIERQLFESSRISLGGVTQQIGRGKVLTQAGFRVSRAGRSFRGGIASKSIEAQPIISGGGFKITLPEKIILTAAKGKTFSRFIKFPGRGGFKFGKEFKIIDIAKVTQRNKLFFTKGFGTTGKGGLFRGAGVSFKRGDFISQLGGTLSRKGSSFSTGLFKIKQGSPTSTFRALGGYPNLNTRFTSISKLRAVNLAGTKSAVRASIKIPPRQPIQFLPTISAQQYLPPTKQEFIAPLKQKFETFQRITAKERVSQTPKVSFRERQKFNQKQIIGQVFAQSESQKVLLKTRQLELQKTAQKQRSLMKTLLTQKLMQEPFMFPRMSFIRGSPKGFPLFIPPLFGQLMPSKSIFATRIFKWTPTLLSVKRFEEFGIVSKEWRKRGFKGLPKIELPITMLGEVTRKRKRKSLKIKTNQRKKKK